MDVDYDFHINTGKLISDVWNMDGVECEEVLRI